MTGVTTETLPAAFMAAGYRLAPRYTINGEVKRIKAWQEKATTEPGKLQELIVEAQQTLNYFKDKGVATDQDGIKDLIVVPPKGRVIIDIDNKNGKPGSANWLALLKALDDGDVQPAMAVKTKTGGFHYYFNADANYIKSVANFAGFEGIDVRGQRGHVVLPFRVGPLETWQPGEYLLYHGQPSDPLTTLRITRLAASFSNTEENLQMEEFKAKVAKMEPVDLIQAGHRDMMLWEAASILYRKGVKRAEADKYMATLAEACELSPDMDRAKAHFTAKEKLDRIFKADRKITSAQDLQRELSLGGIVQVISDTATRYFFKYDNLFRMDRRALYSKEAMNDILKGIPIIVDDGEKTKLSNAGNLFKGYVPDESVYGLGFYPDSQVEVYRDPYANLTLYNTYEPTFRPEEMDDLTKGAEDMFPIFVEFLQFLHPTKWEKMLERMAWTVQFPQLKIVTLSVYVSRKHGIGKDILADLHGLLLGARHYKRVNSIDELTGRFMDLADALLVNIAEVQMGRGLAARNRVVELRGLIKTLVTSSSLKSERKGIQATWRQNFTSFLMTTNEFSPNLLEQGDRRHEVFIMPSEVELPQDKFGRLADLAHTSNFPMGQYPRDKLATIWMGLKRLKIQSQYHVDSASQDDDKKTVFDEGLSHVQAWLLTELPDIFSKDFVAWFLSRFYPQRDKLRPIDEAEYFFRECLHHIRPVMNRKGASNVKLSLTQLHRLVPGSDTATLDLQHKKTPFGTREYYQYLYTIRNHGAYDSQPTQSYYALEAQIIAYYKDQSNLLATKVDDDLHKILQRFMMVANSKGL